MYENHRCASPSERPDTTDRFFYHAFDVRRSKSVDELWRRFEVSPNDATETSDSRDDALRMAHLTGDDAEVEDERTAESATSTAHTPEEQPQSLLAAFEAELARALSSTEASESRNEQPKASHEPGSSHTFDLQDARPVVRDFIQNTLHYLNSQASGISSELATRMPGLRRQLSEAERDLPDSIRELLQGLFASLEHLVTIHGTVPGGRQLAEGFLQAGVPIAENAVESLHALASEFGHAGRTLFTAFENEFGRNGPSAMNPPTGGPSSVSAGMNDVTNPNYTSPSAESQATGSSHANCSSSSGVFTRTCANSAPHSEARTLFIGNVSYKVTAKMIFDVFHSNGFILDVDLPLDTASNSHVGFGYLRFLSASDADLAMQNMQGVHIDGHAINLEFSDTDRLPPVMLHSSYRSAGYAVLDSLRRKPSECGVDHGVRDGRIADEHLARQSINSPSERGKPGISEKHQSADLRHESSSPGDLSTCEHADIPNRLDRNGGRWDNLDTELEMSRFPPISQLDAQHLAEQWRIRAPGPAPNPGASEDPGANNLSRETSSMFQTVSAASAEAPSSRAELRSLHDTAQNGTAMDIGARRVQRGPGRHCPAPYRVGSQDSAWNASQRRANSHEAIAQQAKNIEIENCISSLVKMGFGSPEQGGRARLGIYAAAAKGNVYDAVGMIEEEQKIYADLRLG